MVNQICGPVQARACPQQRLIRDAERIDFKQAVDVHDGREVFNVDLEFWTSQEDDHSVGDHLRPIYLLDDSLGHGGHREHLLVERLQVLEVILPSMV